jgi:hypothetical protein
MKRSHSTDFDVITGPSMASACPVVETVPAELQPVAERGQSAKVDSGATATSPRQPAPASPV